MNHSLDSNKGGGAEREKMEKELLGIYHNNKDNSVYALSEVEDWDGNSDDIKHSPGFLMNIYTLNGKFFEMDGTPTTLDAAYIKARESHPWYQQEDNTKI